MKVNKDELTIRVAEEEDKAYLIQFLLEPGVLTYFPMCDQREVEDAVRISMSYIDYQSAYTAEYQGQICGNMVLYLSPFSKTKHQSLFMIVISEAFRNRNIGTHMLEYLCKAAYEDHGIELLHLEVYEDNPARRLYERNGFVEYGRHPHFLKGPDGFRTKILMQKNLRDFYGRT